MKKYGVHEKNQEAPTKEASDTKQEKRICPVCEEPLKKEGPVLLCPNHGSEPFE